MRHQRYQDQRAKRATTSAERRPRSIGCRPSPGFPPTLLCREPRRCDAPTPSTWREVGRPIKKQLQPTGPWTLSSLQLRIQSFYATENCFWGADKCPIKSDCRFPPRGGKVVDSIKPVENFDRQRYKVESPDQVLFVFSFSFCAGCFRKIEKRFILRFF